MSFCSYLKRNNTGFYVANNKLYTRIIALIRSVQSQEDIQLQSHQFCLNQEKFPDPHNSVIIVDYVHKYPHLHIDETALFTYWSHGRMSP